MTPDLEHDSAPLGELTKHTPGPWHVPAGPFVSGLSVETRADDVQIACPGSGGAMSVTQTICTMEWSGTPEWEANANLIAASPDMLEALKRVLAEKAPAYHDCIDNGESECAWCAARAAIAKAEGGAA